MADTNPISDELVANLAALTNLNESRVCDILTFLYTYVPFQLTRIRIVQRILDSHQRRPRSSRPSLFRRR